MLPDDKGLVNIDIYYSDGSYSKDHSTYFTDQESTQKCIKITGICYSLLISYLYFNLRIKKNGINYNNIGC